MIALQVNQVLNDRILVSREAARQLEDAMRSFIKGSDAGKLGLGTASVTVDFKGVEGIAPSFLDELLTVFESLVGSTARRVVVAHPPTRLSLKFEAIARGHGMSIRAMDDGSWILTGAGGSSP